MSNEEVCCLLVHGTFARKAKWVQEGSSLRRKVEDALKAEGYSVFFKPVPWSGSPLLASRKTAAKLIKQEIDSTPPDIPILLVGHSHGGSAMVYLLNAWPEIFDRVHGIAFLSTPFISLRPRNEMRLLLSSVAVMLAICLYFVSGLSISIYNFFFITEGMPADIFDSIRLFGSILVGVGLVLLSRFYLARIDTYAQAIASRIVSLCREQDSSGMSIAKTHLFIRVTGDEAAAALSFFQFLSFLSSSLGNILGNIALRSAGKIEEIFKNRIAFATSIVFLCILQLGIIHYGSTWLKHGFAYGPLESLIGVNIEYPPPFEGRIPSFASAVIMLVLRGAAIPVAIILCFVAFWLIVLFLRYVSAFVGLLAFGIWAPWEAIFIDFAVEPVPVHASSLSELTSLIHVSWNEQKPSYRGTLNHSRIYLNPLALEFLAHWAQRCMQLHAIRSAKGFNGTHEAS